MGVNVTNLKESNDFLNILFDNITSAIFLVDKEIKIANFNNSFKSLFEKSEDQILGRLCGNALGCIHTVEENADCGTTKNCNTCPLRLSLLESFISKVPTSRTILSREFLIGDKFIMKHFQYSTRYISYNNDEMIIVIVDDITDNETQKQIMAETNNHLIDLNKQQNELLGIAAHDLRNPLSVINSFSEIMYEAAEDMKPENLKEITQIIF
ncbi:MAG: PAS domain-containing protein [Bacteroidales bacterium]|nr:PAS domain-containing protein [Bacteroidales bacterium]